MNNYEKAIYETFGSMLREARKKKNLNQAELGKLMGLSRTSIVNIEQGRQSVSMAQAITLSKGLEFELPTDQCKPLLWHKLADIRTARAELQEARKKYREAQS